MNINFGFSQGSNGTLQYAHIKVPECGRLEKDDAPVVLIEKDLEGNITLLVYGDIKSDKPTHEIPLDGAKLKNKPEVSDVGKVEDQTNASS